MMNEESVTTVAQQINNSINQLTQVPVNISNFNKDIINNLSYVGGGGDMSSSSTPNKMVIIFVFNYW